MSLNYRDLEKRTGVFTDDDECHHDAMPNWHDVCPNCTNPHWAWFKKGEHINVDVESNEAQCRYNPLKIEFVANGDGKLCLRCGEKWIAAYKDPHLQSSARSVKT